MTSDLRSGEQVLRLEVLNRKARKLGFDAVGVAPVKPLPETRLRLQQWLEKGCQAGMRYMERNIEKRENPELLVPRACSVIVTLTNYYTVLRQREGVPLIARYAYGKDYHIVVKQRLYQLMAEMGGPEGRCFVDSAPVFEHEWARRAGLGWVGKNTLLIHKKYGSFCFIGVIFTSAVFDSYSEAFENSYCGRCNRCVEACPTGALSPYQVDARRCISYQTIENKEAVPEKIRLLKGNRIFGCDRCQEVCPWNNRAKQHRVEEFLPDEQVMCLQKEDWLEMSEDKFRNLFENTPLERTGLKKLRSNLDEK